MLHRNKEKAILEWLNCLSLNHVLESLEELKDGKTFIRLIKLIEKSLTINEDDPKQNFKEISKFIDDYYQISSSSFIRYHDCCSGKIFELAKVSVLLLSVFIQLHMQSSSQNLIIPLMNLNDSVQEEIQDCLETVLLNQDRITLGTEIINILARKRKQSDFSHTSSVMYKNSTPTIDKSFNPFRMRGRLQYSDSSPVSPLLAFLESPQLAEKAAIREAKYLRSRLSIEQSRTLELESELQKLKEDFYLKTKEFEDTKKIISNLREFNEIANSASEYKILSEQQKTEIEKLKSRIRELEELKSLNLHLEMENLTLIKKNEELEKNLRNINQLCSLNHQLSEENIICKEEIKKLKLVNFEYEEIIHNLKEDLQCARKEAESVREIYAEKQAIAKSPGFCKDSYYVGECLAEAVTDLCLEELKMSISEMKEELKKKEEKNKILMTENSDLHNDKSKLEDQIKKLTYENLLLNEEMINNIQLLMNKIHKSNGGNAENLYCNKWENILDALEKQQKDYINEINHKEHIIRKLSQEKKELSSEMEKITYDLKTISIDKEKKFEENEKLISAIKELKNEKIFMNSELHQTQEKLEELKKQTNLFNQELENNNINIQIEKEELFASLQKYKLDYNDQLIKYEHAQSIINKISNENALLHSNIESLNQSIEKLSSTNNTIKNDLTEQKLKLNNITKTFKEQIKHYETKILSLEKQNLDLENLNKDLIKELKKLHDDFENLERNINSIMENILFENYCSSLMKSLNDSNHGVNEYKVEKSKLQEIIDIFQKKYREKLQHSNNTNQKLETDLIDVKENILKKNEIKVLNYHENDVVVHHNNKYLKSHKKKSGKNLDVKMQYMEIKIDYLQNKHLVKSFEEIDKHLAIYKEPKEIDDKECLVYVEEKKEDNLNEIDYIRKEDSNKIVPFEEMANNLNHKNEALKIEDFSEKYYENQLSLSSKENIESLYKLKETDNIKFKLKYLNFQIAHIKKLNITHQQYIETLINIMSDKNFNLEENKCLEIQKMNLDTSILQRNKLTHKRENNCLFINLNSSEIFNQLKHNIEYIEKNLLSLSNEINKFQDDEHLKLKCQRVTSDLNLHEKEKETDEFNNVQELLRRKKIKCIKLNEKIKDIQQTVENQIDYIKLLKRGEISLENNLKFQKLFDTRVLEERKINNFKENELEKCFFQTVKDQKEEKMADSQVDLKCISSNTSASIEDIKSEMNIYNKNDQIYTVKNILPEIDSEFEINKNNNKYILWEININNNLQNEDIYDKQQHKLYFEKQIPYLIENSEKLSHELNMHSEFKNQIFTCSDSDLITEKFELNNIKLEEENSNYSSETNFMEILKYLTEILNNTKQKMILTQINELKLQFDSFVSILNSANEINYVELTFLLKDKQTEFESRLKYLNLLILDFLKNLQLTEYQMQVSKNKVDKLLLEIQTLIKMNEELKLCKYSLENKIDVLETKQKNVEEENIQLKEKLQILEGKHEALIVEKNSLQNEFNLTNQEKDKLLNKIKEEEEKLKEIKKKHFEEIQKIKKQEHNQRKETITTITNEMYQLQSKVKDSELQNLKIVQEFKILSNKYENSKEIILKLKEEEKYLKEECDRLNNLLNNSHNKQKSLETELISEPSALEKSNRELNFLKNKLYELQNEKKVLKEQIKHQELQLNNEIEQKKSLDVQLKQAESELKELKFQCYNADLKYDYPLSRHSISYSCNQINNFYPVRKKISTRDERNGWFSSTSSSDDVLKVEKTNGPDSSLNSYLLDADQANLVSTPHLQVPVGTGSQFTCEDEEGEFMNQSHLSDLKAGRCNIKDSHLIRISELQRRNTLCLPHLQSSYPVETQMHSIAEFTDDDLKKGIAVRENTLKLVDSNSKIPIKNKHNKRKPSSIKYKGTENRDSKAVKQIKFNTHNSYQKFSCMTPGKRDDDSFTKAVTPKKKISSKENKENTPLSTPSTSFRFTFKTPDVRKILKLRKNHTPKIEKIKK